MEQVYEEAEEMHHDDEEFRKPVSGRSSRTIKGGKSSTRTQGRQHMTPQNVEPEVEDENMLAQTP